MSLSEQNIESELSFAYLYAVASRAGFECMYAGRHSDGAGVDARIHALGDFGGTRTDITLEVQLKATRVVPVEQDGVYSYSLAIPHYNKLRQSTECQRILVVLYLPEDLDHWMTHTEEQLVLKRCAYWKSLRDAPASENDKNQTVYVPRTNLVTVASLQSLVARRSREEWVNHAA